VSYNPAIALTTLRRILALLLVASLVAACRGEKRALPDAGGLVILISLDTLRADRLNCYGYAERAVSPNIDALAADGIVFENQITTSPWTTPAHLTLLTSLHPSSHGVTGSFRDLRTRLSRGRTFDRLPEARETLAEILLGRGYATAAFTAGVTLDPKIGFAQGFSVYDTTMEKLSADSVRKIEGWLDRHQGQKRFLFWHTFEVHAPYLQTTFLHDVLPAEKTREVVEDLAARAHARDSHRGGYGLRKVLEKHQAFTKQVCDALYMGGVRSADHWVGELVKALRRRGLYDRALIVLTSDHGEELGMRSSGGIYDAHGHTMYDELLRVPLVVKLPGQRHARTRVKSVSSAVDVAPTILDLLSLPPGREMQGRSLRSAWEGPGEQAAGVAYAEALGVEEEKKALRDTRYKYVLSIPAETVRRLGRRHVPADASAELYDLQADPEERTNLLVSPRSAELAPLAARLDQALRVHLSRQRGEAERVELSPETIERLKGLGYVQ
jgi:arylsulfatase A-like enzyme